MDEKIRQELLSKVRENNLLEHQAVIERALSNIGIIPGKGDVREIVRVAGDQVKEGNVKSFSEVFRKHPKVVEILNYEIKENKGVKIDSLAEKLRGKFNEKEVKGIVKIVGKVQRGNEVVLTGKLREHFDNEARRWEG